MEPDFPCIADEIAEPRPDINIKVANFTVSEQSINIILWLSLKSPMFISTRTAFVFILSHEL